MSYHKKLNLPIDPLKDSWTISKTPIIGAYDIMSADILNDTVMEIFDRLSLRVQMVVIFGNNDRCAAEDERLLHTDLIIDPSSNRGWRKLVGGVNWELGNSTNKFYWYDTSSLDEHYPDSNEAIGKYCYLNGIHYVHRHKLGIPVSAKLLDETLIDAPTLIRTDIPHITTYENKFSNRVAVSVRFYEEDFGFSWTELSNKFSTLFR